MAPSTSGGGIGNAAAQASLPARPPEERSALLADENPFEKEIVDGLDGYVAFEPATKKMEGGDPGGVRTADDVLSWIVPTGIAKLLALSDGGEDVTLDGPNGDKVDSGKTNAKGIEPTTADEINQLTAGQDLDPKRGKLLEIIAHAEGKTTEQRVQALPKDYDGPLFVSDIDDTLRPTQIMDVLKGVTQGPIAGARELLEGVAARGVPIIYLSAGPQAIGEQNDDFLKQMPKGILLARGQMDLGAYSPRNSDQAESQGNYKAKRLKEIKATFPNAQIFGFGDDKYGDANAYTEVGATAYIHDVRKGDDNIPADFKGTQTKDYDEKFRNKVLGDLDVAIGKSRSFQQ